MKILLSLLVLLTMMACVSEHTSDSASLNSDDVDIVDSTDNDTADTDTSSLGEGAISGEAKEPGTVIGDSIIGWNTIADSITLADGQKFGLTWIDQFDEEEVDDRWYYGAWSFDENASFFNKSQIQKNDTTLGLVLAKDSTDKYSDKDYIGGEAYTKEKYKFGRYVVRMKPTAPSGVISSFFLIDIAWEDGAVAEWYEIDIEFVGAETTNRVQLNLRSTLPGEKRIKDDAVIVDLPFDAAEDFHVYTIDWTETYISFFADGQLLYTYDDVEFAGRQAHEQSVRFNYWPTNIPEWSGEIDTTAFPCQTEYDYVAVYAGEVVE